MAVVLNAKGTSVSSFQIGKQGPLIKNSSGTLEFRNTADSDFIEIKADSPTTSDSVATKQYVDSVVSGLDTKNAVRATTIDSSDLTGFIYTASLDDGTAGAAPWTNVTSPVFDGITLADGERVLIKESTDAKGNGIFTYDSGASKFVRASDADNSPSNEVSGGMFAFVEEGTLADTGWVMSSPNGAATLGTDDLVFTQFSSAGVVTAGNGLIKSGTTIDVVGTSNRISVSSDAIDISSSYVGQSSIITLGTIVGFTSTGIDDNAASTAITIDGSNNTTFGGILLADDGIVGAPAYSFSSDTDTGMWREDEGRLSFATNGVNQMSIDGSGDLEVGESGVTGISARFIKAASNVNYIEFSGGVTGVDPTIIIKGTDTNVGLAIETKGTGEITFDTNSTQAMVIDSDQNVGIGISTPDGPLHVQAADAVAAANTNSNTLVLENTSQAGISILTPNTSIGSIYFGDPDDNDIGQIRYDHSTDEIIFTVGAADAMSIGDPSADGTLHVFTADSGAFTPNVDADDLIIENSTNVGIQLVCPSGDLASIHFGRNDDPDRGKLVYSLSDNTMRFTVNTDEHLTLFNDGRTGLGKATPAATLDIDSNAAAGDNNAIRINAVSPAMFWEPESASHYNFKVSAQDGVTNTWQVFGSTAASADALSDSWNSIITVVASNQRVGIGTSAPEGKLHVLSASAGSVVVNGNADELVLEGSGTTGMSFLSPAAQNQHIYFGDADDNDIGQITYAHGDNSMRFIVNTTERMHIFSDGDVAIGDIPGTPNGTLHVEDASTNIAAGFYRDVDFGDSTQDVAIELGNSGADQGKLRIVYFNNSTASSQLAKIDFLPRNAADTDKKQGGQILFTNDSDSSGEIRFGAPNNSGTLMIVSLDGDDQVLAPNTSGQLSLGRTGKRWGNLWLSANARIDGNAVVGDASASPTATFEAHESGTGVPAITALTTSASFGDDILTTDTNTVSGTGFNHIRSTSDVDGTPDPVFNVRGDGEVTADGSFTGGGADYADYFEWNDGNPDDEDRVGCTVVLASSGKIKIAQNGEAPIGVISGKPSVSGNAATISWDGKFLKDEYNRYILSDQGSKIVNPDYDPEAEYTPRPARAEWDAVGLVGRLPVNKGQVISSSWTKIRDISDNVEEWLITGSANETHVMTWVDSPIIPLNEVTETEEQAELIKLDELTSQYYAKMAEGFVFQEETFDIDERALNNISSELMFQVQDFEEFPKKFTWRGYENQEVDMKQADFIEFSRQARAHAKDLRITKTKHEKSIKRRRAVKSIMKYDVTTGWPETAADYLAEK